MYARGLDYVRLQMHQFAARMRMRRGTMMPNFWRLQHLPGSLYKTYDRIVLRVEKHDRHAVLNVLKWLTCSPLRLSPDEVAEIFVLDLDETNMRLTCKERLGVSSYITKILSSFVEEHSSGQI